MLCLYIDENEDGGVCVHIKSFGDILKWFGPLVTDTETVLDRIPRILEKEYANYYCSFFFLLLLLLLST